MPANAGDASLILGSERSLKRKWQPTPVFLPGKFHGKRRLTGSEAWQATVHGVTKSQTQLSMHTHNENLPLVKNSKLFQATYNL